MIADASVSDADIDAFVAEFEASFVPGESEEDAGPVPEIVDGLRLPAVRARAGSRSCSCTASAATSTTGSSTPSRCRRDRAVYALDLPGHGGSVKEARDLVDALRALPGFAGDRPGSPRRALDGRPRRRRVRGCRARAGALLGPDRTRRARHRDLHGLHRRVRRRELAQAAQAGAAEAVRRSRPGQPVDGRRRAQVQAARRGAGDAGRAARPAVRGRLAVALARPVVLLAGRCWCVGRGRRDHPGGACGFGARGAEVKVLPDVGHSPHMEAAGEVNRLLEGFLAGVRAH